MKAKTLRYRAPLADGPPPVGAILMGDGPRTRRGYRILGVRKSKSSQPALGVTTWRLTVESMPKERAMEDVDAGVPWWSLVWDSRERRH